MSSSLPPGRVALRSLWVLVGACLACVATYLLGLLLTVTVVESMPARLATGLAFVLAGGEVLVTFLAIAWVHIRLGDLLQTLARWFWVGVFALLQLGVCALAVVTTLLALNR